MTEKRQWAKHDAYKQMTNQADKMENTFKDINYREGNCKFIIIRIFKLST